jgi:hypothetical protein
MLLFWHFFGMINLKLIRNSPLCVRIVFASKKLFNSMGEARYENTKKVFRRVQVDDNQKDDATSSGICLKII